MTTVPSRTWTDGNTRTHVKGHVIRLGIDVGHLGSRELPAPVPLPIAPDLAHLREAGPSLAAAWFALCGCGVLFPIEPAIYDLVVSMPDGLSRVQVKTTTSKGASGWQVGIGLETYGRYIVGNAGSLAGKYAGGVRSADPGGRAGHG